MHLTTQTGPSNIAKARLKESRQPVGWAKDAPHGLTTHTYLGVSGPGPATPRGSSGQQGRGHIPAVGDAQPGGGGVGGPVHLSCANRGGEWSRGCENVQTRIALFCMTCSE